MVGPSLYYSDKLHAEKYRLPGESFRDAMVRIANALKDDEEHFHQFKEVLLDMRFLPAGRVQSAMGAPKTVTALNCFVGGTIPDSFVTRDNDYNSSIMDRAAEAATTMRMGGGIGNDFSTLRPRGAFISKIRSSSSGPLKFMQIFNSIGDATSSTGERRGAQMGVLRVDHPDILEFISAKHNNTNLTRFNISVAITDKFMEHLQSGKPFPLIFNGEIYRHVDPQELWETLMQSTWNWAEPGTIFIDRVNYWNNLYYCETIAASNPCFTGDTKVWTSKGHKTFAELAATGEDVKVLTQRADGRVVYRTMKNPRVTQCNVKIIELGIKSTATRTRKSEISYLRCTPEHKFFLTDGTSVMAKDLTPEMSLCSVYRHKANSKGYLKIRDLMEHHIPFENMEGLGSKYHVHHIDENKQNNDPDNLQVLESHVHNGLNMFGDRNPARRFPERQNRKGNLGTTNGRWRKDIDTSYLRELRASGLTAEAIAEKLNCSKYLVGTRLGEFIRQKNHKVVSIRWIEQKEDVYCGTVEETGKFFVTLGKDHGVLVSNCSEQMLPPNGACLLGSYNLTKYIKTDAHSKKFFDFDLLAYDIPIVTRAMDNILDRTIYPLTAQEVEAKNKRRMGIGGTGLANAGEVLGYSYGSKEFVEFENKFNKILTRLTYLASSELAREKGSFPLFDADKYCNGNFIKTLDSDIQECIYVCGIRNSHLISWAPTGTISMTADNVSSSLEPVYQWKQERPVELSSGVHRMEIYDYGFREWGVRGKRAANSEVTVKEHVDVLVTAQKHTDSAVSKTVNTDGSMAWEDFKNVYLDAYNRGAKGCTTFNKDGKRFSLFKNEVEPNDLQFPEEAKAEEYTSCTFDPASGRRTCE